MAWGMGDVPMSGAYEFGHVEGVPGKFIYKVDGVWHRIDGRTVMVEHRAVAVDGTAYELPGEVMRFIEA